MRNYVLSLSSIGGFTQLPDSQKVFGALIYTLSASMPEKQHEVTRIVRDIHDGKLHLALSNMLPEGFLPTPYDYILSRMHIEEEASRKAQYKALKKREYQPEGNIVRLMNEPAFMPQNAFPYIRSEFSQQLRVGIKSDILDVPGLDNDLYSVPKITLRRFENSKAETNAELAPIVTDFYVFVSIGDGDDADILLSALQNAVDEGHTWILGKRASQGMNLFALKKLSPIPNGLFGGAITLNLGMLLPNNIDYPSSTLRLFTSERRPFDKPQGWDSIFERRFISFIAEGSLIRRGGLDTPVGKCIESPFDKGRSIVFGNAYQFAILRA